MSSEGDHRGERRARWPDAGEKQPLTSVSTRQQHIATMAKKYAGSPLTTLSYPHGDARGVGAGCGRAKVLRHDSAPAAPRGSPPKDKGRSDRMVIPNLANTLPEEPDALIALVRVCGGVGA